MQEKSALGNAHNWSFSTETIERTNTLLTHSKHIILSCDSIILDRTTHWCNLAREVITRRVPDAWIVGLGS